MQLHISEKSGRGIPTIIESYGKEAIEIRNNPNVTNKQLSVIIGISETAIENNIRILRENKIVERIGSKQTGFWKIIE